MSSWRIPLSDLDYGLAEEEAALRVIRSKWLSMGAEVEAFERELQVIKEIISGSPNKDIAQKLSISEQAVKYHLTNIISKTGISGRMELARFAIRHQLVREA